MKNLYENLGFKSNPFSKFSAEEEVSYLDEIYYPPRYYNTLKSDLIEGNSRFITGNRGSGKTALLLKLKKDLDSENVFTLIIDEFSDLPIVKNKKQMLIHIISEYISNYCISLSQTPHLLRNLNKGDKKRLAFFVKEFFRPITNVEYEDYLDKITRFKTRNIVKRIFNTFFHKPINIMTSGIVEVISTSVAKSLRLPDVDSGEFYKSYFGEQKVEKFSTENQLYKKQFSIKHLKSILIDLNKFLNHPKKTQEELCENLEN